MKRRRSGAGSGRRTRRGAYRESTIGELILLSAAGMIFIVVIPIAAVALLGGGLDGFSGIFWNGEDEPNPSDRIETPETITVWQSEKKKTVEVDFEEYVSRVVASEMPGTFQEEALKAQSVAARTYAMSRLVNYEEKKPEAHPKAPVCDTTHCQVYKTEKTLIDIHAEGWEQEEWAKIQKACRATEGQLLYYEGELVMQPLFFSSSGGQTENSEDVFVSAVPYLISVESPYEEEATHREEEKRFAVKDFAEKLEDAYPQRELGDISQKTIKILDRTAGGRVSRMQVGDGEDGILKGTEVRTALGLSSALFTIRFEEDRVIFTSSGSGHGVGLSQYGADGMAREGYDYKEILRHYYSGTQVG